MWSAQRKNVAENSFRKRNLLPDGSIYGPHLLRQSASHVSNAEGCAAVARRRREGKKRVRAMPFLDMALEEEKGYSTTRCSMPSIE